MMTSDFNGLESGKGVLRGETEWRYVEEKVTKSHSQYSSNKVINSRYAFNNERSLQLMRKHKLLQVQSAHTVNLLVWPCKQFSKVLKHCQSNFKTLELHWVCSLIWVYLRWSVWSNYSNLDPLIVPTLVIYYRFHPSIVLFYHSIR